MLFPVPSMKSWPLQRKSFIFCNIVASTKLPFVFYNIVGPICNFVKSDSRRSLPPPADPLIARTPNAAPVLVMVKRLSEIPMSLTCHDIRALNVLESNAYSSILTIQQPLHPVLFDPAILPLRGLDDRAMKTNCLSLVPSKNHYRFPDSPGGWLISARPPSVRQHWTSSLP